MKVPVFAFLQRKGQIILEETTQDRKNHKLIKTDNKVLFSIKAALLPSLLISANLFIFGPAIIFQENRNEFNVRFLDFFGYYYYPFFIFSAVLIIAGFTLFRRVFTLYISLIFTLGLLLMIEGNVFVWNYGPLDGNPILWETFRLRGVFDLAVWLVLISLSIIFHRKLASIAAFSSFGFLLLQSMLLIFTIVSSSGSFISAAEAGMKESQKIFDYSKEFNIVHIILDSFQSDFFEKIVEEEGLEEVFDGFVFFKENMTVANTTALAIPAILTGQEPGTGYTEKLMREKSILNILSENGFDTNLVLGKRILVGGHPYYLPPNPYGGTHKEIRATWALFLMDLTLFRHLPHLLKRYVYNDQNWILKSSLSMIGQGPTSGFYHSKQFFEDYIHRLDASKEGPSYHFIHIVPPHGPYTMAEDCSYAGGTVRQLYINYKIQARCMTGLFSEFIDKLKEEGVYDSSFIILQGDHGLGFLAEQRNRASKGSTENHVSQNTMARSLALLAVKRPNARGRLKVSSALTSVLDVAPTVLKAAGLEADNDAKSLFEIDPFEKRLRWFKNQYRVNGSAYSRDSWYKEALPKHLLESKDKVYSWGSTLQFGYMGDAEFYIRKGWHKPNERKHRTMSWAAEIVLPTEKPPERDLTLTLTFSAHIFPGRLDYQRISVVVNGSEVSTWRVEDPLARKIVRKAVIPAGLIGKSQTMSIYFILPDAKSAHALGFGRDEATRNGLDLMTKLGISVYSMVIE